MGQLVPEPLTLRAVVARRALLGAVLLGVLADFLLRNGLWGLGLSVWMVVLAALVVVLVRSADRALSYESAIWLTVALLFAAGLAWHDAELLLAFNFLAMLSALVLLALSMNAAPVSFITRARVRDLIGGAAATGFAVAGGIAPLFVREAQLGNALVPHKGGGMIRLGRAALISAPILFVFALLLTSADPVFKSFFVFPDLRIDELLSHILIPGFFAWVVAGWLRRSLFAGPGVAVEFDPQEFFKLGTTDVVVALGALNVLFAAFVAVQIGWLFGGAELVLRTSGLTYAEYARRGFFELMWVAGLLLPVLLSAHALIPAGDLRTLRIYRRLSLPLVALLVAILASAGARMNLYVQYYGLSSDRLFATAIMVWLGIVFVWFVATVLRARPHAFAAGLVISGFAVLLSLNRLNPDAIVARSNLARADAVRAGAAGRDLRYVATLGGDAVPALVAVLTAPGTPVDEASCTAARMLLERWTGEHYERRTARWTQWNYARSRAAEAVRAREPELRRLACARPTDNTPPVSAPPVSAPAVGTPPVGAAAGASQWQPPAQPSAPGNPSR